MAGLPSFLDQTLGTLPPGKQNPYAGLYGNPGPQAPGSGSVPYSPSQSSIYSGLFEDDPQAGYRRFMESTGLHGLGQRQNFYADQYQRENQQYNAALPELGGNATFLDYLTTQQPDIESMYKSQTQRQLGNAQGGQLPRVRYIL